MFRHFLGTLRRRLSPVPSNFTPRAQQVLALSRRQAAYLGHPDCRHPHLLLAILQLNEHCEPRMVPEIGLSHAEATAAVCRVCPPLPSTLAASGRPYAPEYRELVVDAGQLARDYRHDWVGVHHLWLALLNPPREATSAVLAAAGMDAGQLRDVTIARLEASPAQGATVSEAVPVPPPEPPKG